MNKVVLMGRLTRDPELRSTASGMSVTSFSLAVDRNFQNQNGEREADFINIVMWGKQADTAKQYLFKGTKILVEGRIQTRNYDGTDGKKVYVTEVVADRFEFCESKGSNSKQNFDASYDNSYFGGNNYQQQNNDVQSTNVSDEPYIDMGNAIEFSDEDIAF